MAPSPQSSIPWPLKWRDRVLATWHIYMVVVAIGYAFSVRQDIARGSDRQEALRPTYRTRNLRTITHSIRSLMRDAASHAPEEDLERRLRPSRLDEFIGQEQIKDNLNIFIRAAQAREEVLDHVLLSGPPGLGKTTLASIIAHEMKATIRATSGPVIDKPANMAGLLTQIEEGDVLFIDEIHRLNPVVEEYLYSAMEDYHIDILIDSGPSARSVRITLPPFTLVGATTRKGLLTSPLRARFGIDFRYDYYSVPLLQQIVTRSAALLRMEIDTEGALEIARRSRGTPRIANRLLRRTRDFAQVESDGVVTRKVANRALNALNVDQVGLDDMDSRILTTLIEKFGGGPTGLNTLAVSVGEEAGTLEEVYEPYLIQEGFLERTPRGRMATQQAYDHFGLKRKGTRASDLFES